MIKLTLKLVQGKGGMNKRNKNYRNKIHSKERRKEEINHTEKVKKKIKQ